MAVPIRKPYEEPELTPLQRQRIRDAVNKGHKLSAYYGRRLLDRLAWVERELREARKDVETNEKS